MIGGHRDVDDHVPVRAGHGGRGAARPGDVRLDAVDGPSIATCGLRCAGGNGVYTNQTCPFTGAVTGSHRIYLVFSQATGGPASGFGLLNWVEFSGAGI